MANYESVNTAIPDEERSCFDGGYFAYIGYSILVGFVTIITLGIAYPWMCCVFQRWKAKHTVVCGKRMYFDGTGLQLIGNYLLWMLLSVITLGIYSLWMSVSIRKWITKHTHYVGEGDDNSYFDGGVLGLLGTNILAGLVLAVPFVGPAWSKIIKLRWETGHTVVDSRRHIFVGSVGGLFVKYLLWGLLTVITLGIFAWFMPVKVLRWETENKIDNEHTTQEMIARGEYRANVHTDGASFKTYKVEDDMECVKAGVTDTIGQDDLLALANSGVRAAQYAYVTRYAQGQYTQEPFSGLLKAAAEAGYTPAMSLYLQTHTMDEQVRMEMLKNAVQRGDSWCIHTLIIREAKAALEQNEDKQALPALKSVVRYADLLRENQEQMTAEEAELVQKCIFAIRRIQSAQPLSNRGKIVGIVVGILIGVPVLLALVVGVVALARKTVDKVGNILPYEILGSSEELPSYMAGEFNDLPENTWADMDEIPVDAVSGMAGSSENMGFLSIMAQLFGDKRDESDLTDSFVAQAPSMDNVMTGETVSNIQTTESDFWKRFVTRMEEEYCVVTQVDTAEDGTVKYEITCDHWFWKSLHYMEVLQTADGVQRMRLWGVRIYEPDSPDPTMNEVQWTTIVREVFKQLDLGDYDGIIPYIESGTHTDTYNGWEFSYNNTADEVSVSICTVG